MAVATRSVTKVRPRAARRRAVGVITGVNHLVLICKDMEETLRFYCGILGLKVKTSSGGAAAQADGAGRHFYWLEVRNGDVLALYEVPEGDTTADASTFSRFWPTPGRRQAPSPPRKMDHLALNVETLADLKAVQRKLRKHGWPVSEIRDSISSSRWDASGNLASASQVRVNPAPQFPLVSSIYFYDPNGVPLEVATWDFGGPEWRGVQEKDWYRDTDPPPFIRSQSTRLWRAPASSHRAAPRR